MRNRLLTIVAITLSSANLLAATLGERGSLLRVYLQLNGERVSKFNTKLRTVTMVDKALALCLILIYPFFYATAEAKPPKPLSTKAPADLVIDSVKVTSYNSSTDDSARVEGDLTYSGSTQMGLFLLPGDGSDNEVTVVVRNQGFSDISRRFQVSLSLARGRSLSPVAGGTYELTVPNLSSGMGVRLLAL